MGINIDHNGISYTQTRDFAPSVSAHARGLEVECRARYFEGKNCTEFILAEVSWPDPGRVGRCQSNLYVSVEQARQLYASLGDALDQANMAEAAPLPEREEPAEEPAEEFQPEDGDNGTPSCGERAAGLA